MVQSQWFRLCLNNGGLDWVTITVIHKDSLCGQSQWFWLWGIWYHSGLGSVTITDILPVWRSQGLILLIYHCGIMNVGGFFSECPTPTTVAQTVEHHRWFVTEPVLLHWFNNCHLGLARCGQALKKKPLFLTTCGACHLINLPYLLWLYTARHFSAMVTEPIFVCGSNSKPNIMIN